MSVIDREVRQFRKYGPYFPRNVNPWALRYSPEGGIDYMHMAASEGPNVVIQMIAWCQHPVSVYPCTVSCSVVNKHYLCFQSVIDYIDYTAYLPSVCD